jgi:hypothetical protein
MPLTNEARQKLRNFYKTSQQIGKAKKLSVSVSRVNNANNYRKKHPIQQLSPQKGKTKTGRPYSVLEEVRSNNGLRLFSIQRVRPNSRKM